MSSWILRGNGNRILGSDGRDLVKNAVLDSPLDLFDLLESLFLVEAVQEEINVARGCKVLVVVFAQASLTSRPLLRNGQESGGNRTSSRDDIVPIEICKRRLGEQVEILLEVFERRDDGRGAARLAFSVLQRHEIRGLLLIGLGLEGSSSDLEISVGKQGNKVGVAIFDSFVVGLLSVNLSEFGFVRFVRLEESGDGGIRVPGQVRNEVLDRCWQWWDLNARGRRIDGRHVTRLVNGGRTMGVPNQCGEGRCRQD